MKRLILVHLHTAAALASLVSLLAMLVMERWHATIALLSLNLYLAALLVIVYVSLNGYARIRYPDGYSRLSTFARYSTSDGKHIVYEVYRHI